MNSQHSVSKVNLTSANDSNTKKEILSFCFSGLSYTITFHCGNLYIEAMRKRDYSVWSSHYLSNKDTSDAFIISSSIGNTDIKYTPDLIFTMLKDFVYGTLKKNTQIKFSSGNILDTENIIISIITDLGYSGVNDIPIHVVPKKISEEEKHKKVAAYLEGKNLKLNNRIISLENKLSLVDQRVSILEKTLLDSQTVREMNPRQPVDDKV